MFDENNFSNDNSYEQNNSQATGYTLTDGLHYSKGTSKTLYKYYLSALGRV